MLAKGVRDEYGRVWRCTAPAGIIYIRRCWPRLWEGTSAIAAWMPRSRATMSAGSRCHGRALLSRAPALARSAAGMLLAAGDRRQATRRYTVQHYNMPFAGPSSSMYSTARALLLEGGPLFSSPRGAGPVPSPLGLPSSR